MNIQFHKSKNKQFKIWLILLINTLSFSSCGIYSLSGAKIDAKTIQVNYFPNNANLVEPTLSQKFTVALQDLFLQQSNLNLVKSDGELQFEGEITDYIIRPTAATSKQTADLNRLTVKVKVRFYNNLNDEDNFEQTFSHFHDFPANQQLIGSTLEDAYNKILERITQDIFNASVAKW
jgi:hypothetical protein